MSKLFIGFFIVAVLFLGLAPLMMYLIQFSPEFTLPTFLEKNLSYKNEDWANFGSFISGTSGAIFSFFGTLAVVWTLIVTHKSSEGQIKMLRTEQTFSQFNELLKVLTSLLNEKKYPDTNFNNGNFYTFTQIAYENIANLLNEYLSENPRMKNPSYYDNIAFVSLFHDKYMVGTKKDLFKKEAAIFSILLEKIISSDFSTQEALMAILDARLNEDYYFFFHCEHMEGKLTPQLERMLKSGIPMLIPSELSNRFHKELH